MNTERVMRYNVGVSYIIPQPLYILKMPRIKLSEDMEYFVNLDALEETN